MILLHFKIERSKEALFRDISEGNTWGAVGPLGTHVGARAIERAELDLKLRSYLARDINGVAQSLAGSGF